MNPAFKFALSFIGLAHMLAGCGHRQESKPDSGDAQLTKVITGTWAQETGRLSGRLSMLADGTFSSVWTVLAASNTKTWFYEGSWKITNGMCSLEPTNNYAWNTTNVLPVGEVQLFKILRADSRELVWVYDAQTNAFQRER